MPPSPPRSRATSPPTSPRSVTRGDSQYTPVNPSRLRTSIAASPEARKDSEQHSLKSRGLEVEPNRVEPTPARSGAIAGDEGAPVQGRIAEPHQPETDARTRALENYHRTGACGSRDCSHGTFSPHLRSSASSVSSTNGFGGRWPGGVTDDGDTRDHTHGYFGDMVADGALGGRQPNISTTKWLAQRHGIKNSRTMSVRCDKRIEIN